MRCTVIIIQLVRGLLAQGSRYTHELVRYTLVYTHELVMVYKRTCHELVTCILTNLYGILSCNTHELVTVYSLLVRYTLCRTVRLGDRRRRGATLSASCIMCWTTRLTNCIKINMANVWESMALLQTNRLS